MEVKRILIFDIQGYMAHFRKFFSNSSSFTYNFPPCTTVGGLIAGILGRPRDSYYDEFNSENCRIGIAVKTGTRKIVQTMNYVRTKTKGEFNGSGGPTPTPIEILLSEKTKLHFRVYFVHNNQSLLDEVKERIQNQRYVYPPYLGITEFIAQLTYVADINSDQITKIESDEIIKIGCPINTDFIRDKGIAFEDQGEPLRVFLERMPVEFDSSRQLKRIGSFTFEADGKLVPVRLNTKYYHIEYNGQSENVLFLNQ